MLFIIIFYIYIVITIFLATWILFSSFDSDYYSLQLVDASSSPTMRFICHNRSSLSLTIEISEDFALTILRFARKTFSPDTKTDRTTDLTRARLIIVSSFQKTSARFSRKRKSFRRRGKKESIDFAWPICANRL